MDVKKIGKRIEEARLEKPTTYEHIANEIGVAKSTIQRYEKGLIETPKMPVLESIARVLGVNPAWICCKSEEKYLSSPHRNVIPVFGRVAAGIPIEAIEDVVDTEEISDEMARKGQYFGVRIQGDSMEPRIFDGDTVIVLRQSDADNGDIVIARINGTDAACKKLLKYEGYISLVSLNPKYSPMIFTKKQIGSIPVDIAGVVVEVRGKLK